MYLKYCPTLVKTNINLQSTYFLCETRKVCWLSTGWAHGDEKDFETDIGTVHWWRELLALIRHGKRTSTGAEEREAIQNGRDQDERTEMDVEQWRQETREKGMKSQLTHSRKNIKKIGKKLLMAEERRKGPGRDRGTSDWQARGRRVRVMLAHCSMEDWPRSRLRCCGTFDEAAAMAAYINPALKCGFASRRLIGGDRETIGRLNVWNRYTEAQ